MKSKKFTPKSEISTFFKKVVGWYLSGKMDCTRPNPLLEKEYYELVEVIANHPMTKVINRDNKFYIVGILESFTNNHKHIGLEKAIENAVWFVTDRDYFTGSDCSDDGRTLPVLTDLSTITIYHYS